MLPLTINSFDENEVIVGCDEVGRGCGAFTVCAAAVIWPTNFIPMTSSDQAMLDMVIDSKKLSEKKREIVAEFIKLHALAYSIASIDNDEIDRINILNATYKAMHNALDGINIPFDHIAVDGNRFKSYMNKEGDFVHHTCIINGDNTLFQIAAASILAKVHRDKQISDLAMSDDALQKYGWEKNKGYLTKQHLDAIRN
jgi:ribonuclease HII